MAVSTVSASMRPVTSATRSRAARSRPPVAPPPPAASEAYPASNVVDVALRDGSTVQVRPVRADDEAKLRRFLVGLSAETAGLRFFGALNLEWVTAWSVDVDYADRYALVATAGAEARVVAHGAYVRIDQTRAEVAFMVSDAWQGRGIATIMLAHLAAVAEQHGITTFTAEVLPRNHRMIAVFRESGFPVSIRTVGDVIEVEFPTSLSPEARAHFEEREKLAALASMKNFMRPRNVAVIGASRRRGTIGAALMHNLVSGGYSGALYPVNPSARTIEGHRAYPSIGAVPEPVDLAVVAVPAEAVAGVAAECGSAGTHALLVISAGFAEVGAEGARRQRELLEICRGSGMRLIGPNCLGVLNTAPDVRLEATFAARAALPGRAGFLSQSGGLGIAMIEAADRLGLGLSSFVSVGNKADISGNDLLHYWEQDPNTDLVLLYLESFGNPRRFARVARGVSATKPIIAVKSGRSAAGARATSSHTGALISASDVTVDALFRQAGVIRTDTMHELFDVAALLSAQPIPRGARVAIVTNAGGPGILCADACQANGLDVVELPERARRKLATFLPAAASTANPIDMIATARAGDYQSAIETLVDAEACDAIIAIFVPPLVTRGRDVALAIHAADARDVPVAAVFMSADARPKQLQGAEKRIPAFDFPEDAAVAVAHAAWYGRWRMRTPGTVPRFDDVRPGEAAAIITTTLAAGDSWLAPGDVNRLLACYGLPVLPTHVAAKTADAIAAATEIGGPVALKAVAPGLIHKTDAGGVKLGLSGPTAVRAGVRDIRASLARSGHRLREVLVQPMAASGVELLMGVVHDESFGPVIAFGAGGTSAELLKDVTVRITPLTDVDAHEMVHGLRTFPLLEGYRGSPACDVAAVEEMLLRLSALVEAHPEVVELDANPVIAGPDGAAIVDARIRVAEATPARPLAALRA